MSKNVKKLKEKIANYDQLIEMEKSRLQRLQASQDLLVKVNIEKDDDVTHQIVKMSEMELFGLCDEETLGRQKKNSRDFAKLTVISMTVAISAGLAAFAAEWSRLSMAGSDTSIGNWIMIGTTLLILISLIATCVAMTFGLNALIMGLINRKVIETKKQWDEKMGLQKNLKNRYVSRLKWLKKEEEVMEPSSSPTSKR